MLTKKKVIIGSVSLLAPTLLLPNYLQTKSASAVEQNTQFQVNVRESLVVSITTPSSWATGDVDQFLRNKINVNVETNNAYGFVATMTTKTNSTDLVHTANKGTIPTLSSSSTRSSFPVNRWGYSLNDTDAGLDSSTYSALVGVSGTPITLISNAQSQTINNRDVFFGAKADTSIPSGTYVSTVVINVVTGTVDENNPVTPVNPATDNPTPETPSYSGTGTHTGNTTNGSTTYTYTRTSGSGSNATTTITTEVSDGDNRDAYTGYTPPQGVTTRQTTTESVSEGSSLAAGLAVTSTIAATSGILFFILAKRKKDEEEDEEEEEQQ